MNIEPVEDGVRPAGPPDKCFYCSLNAGVHSSDCTVPQRSVVLKMTVFFIARVPRVWSKEAVEFHRNESSYCADNDAKDMIDNHESCLCHRSSVELVREATAKDHKEMGWSPKPRLKPEEPTP